MAQEKRPRVITTRVTEAEGEQLSEIAARDRRTIGELGYFAIQEYIARRKAGAPVTPVLEEAPSLEPDVLTPDERLLVDIFRQAPADRRLQALECLRDSAPRRGKTRQQPAQTQAQGRGRKEKR